MMKLPLFRLLPLAAVALLSACGTETITASNDVDPDAATVAAAPAVTLPPMVSSSRSYRCTDNSLAYVDFLSDDKTANFRTDKAGPPTVLTAPEAGQPFVAEGYSVSGNGTTVTIEQPGKGSQECKA